MAPRGLSEVARFPNRPYESIAVVNSDSVEAGDANVLLSSSF